MMVADGKRKAGHACVAHQGRRGEDGRWWGLDLHMELFSQSAGLHTDEKHAVLRTRSVEQPARQPVHALHCRLATQQAQHCSAGHTSGGGWLAATGGGLTGGGGLAGGGCICTATTCQALPRFSMQYAALPHSWALTVCELWPKGRGSECALESAAACLGMHVNT